MATPELIQPEEAASAIPAIVPAPLGDIPALSADANLPSAGVQSTDTYETPAEAPEVAAPASLGHPMVMKDTFQPPPPARITGKNPDGSVQHSNGVRYYKNDDHIEWNDGAGGKFVGFPNEPIMHYPAQVAAKPTLKTDAATGRTFDVTDPTNPKEIKFPPAQETALPAGDEAIAQKISEYKYPLPSGFALKTPAWRAIMGRAAEINPAFDATQYQTRQSIRKAYTSGKASQNITSINTAVNHLNELRSAADALDNSNWHVYNTIANAIRNERGDPRISSFASAATAVENEMATVFKGTAGTDQEIKSWRAQLNNSQSPAQLHASINKLIELMGGRIQALKGTYENGMGAPAEFDVLNPVSKHILQKIGADPDALEGKVGEPTSTPTPPPQRDPKSLAAYASQIVNDPKASEEDKAVARETLKTFSNLPQ